MSTSWFEGAEWVKEPGDELILLLARSFPQNDQIRELLEGINHVEYLPGGNLIARLQWLDLLPKLLEDGLLLALLDKAVALKPLLEPEIVKIGALAVAGVKSMGAKDYQVLLIDPGRTPLVDRADLRQRFEEFVEQSYPVLLVVGPDRSGKTHSCELFKHVLTTRKEFDYRKVDFSSPSSGNDGAQLLSLLSTRLGMKDVTGSRVRRTTPTRHAVDLVNIFVGKYKGPAKGKRVIVIDGLNRKDLKPDVYEVAANLIAEAASASLPDTQLIIAGYSGGYDPQFRYQVLKESIVPITRSHLRLFFQGVGKEHGRVIPRQSLTDMVRTVMEDKPPLDVFGDRVRDEALKLVNAR